MRGKEQKNVRQEEFDIEVNVYILQLILVKIHVIFFAYLMLFFLLISIRYLKYPPTFVKIYIKIL